MDVYFVLNGQKTALWLAFTTIFICANFAIEGELIVAISLRVKLKCYVPMPACL